MVTVIGGFVLIGLGKSVIGIAAIITSLASLAAVFIYSKRVQRKERVEKQSALLSRKAN
jgi:hypothetical protein